ncbi:hypothetical protein BZA77DRAFT_355642 [Pyronema omphalodes]|nr:hypothetical protein BZA77DRAFT_355642 [Pyronema omphalodes]
MPSQNNSSPGMFPRPPIWQLDSPIDDMDVDASVPQQQPPPQQMNGFFQGFVQASGGPQSAIPADVQYSRNSDPATTPDRQSPIDNMAAPMDILLGSLQRMNISPGDLSGEPSGLHNEMPANIQNPPAAHVPPVSTFNVADTAMGDTTSKSEMISDAQAARIERELFLTNLERMIKMHEDVMKNSTDSGERFSSEYFLSNIRPYIPMIQIIRDRLHNAERGAREMSRVVRGLD